MTEGKEVSPREAAIHMGWGFVAHDEGDRQSAEDAFTVVDQFQFDHLTDEEARTAAIAYVDALWHKDDLEDRHRRNDGTLRRADLDDVDWSDVYTAFRKRASIADIDPLYAEASLKAWKRHKTGGDYWTPMMQAQLQEVRAAMQDPEYPHKERGGQQGFGELPVRYLLGVELHDTRQYEHGLSVMEGYYERIADTHDSV